MCRTKVVTDWDSLERVRCPKCLNFWEEEDAEGNARTWEKLAIGPAPGMYEQHGRPNHKDRFRPGQPALPGGAEVLKKDR